jgi:hypothetical protein
VEALHTTLVNRLSALRIGGVDRGTAIIRHYPTQPQDRFLKTTTPRSGSAARNYVSQPSEEIGVIVVSYETGDAGTRRNGTGAAFRRKP